MNLCVVSPFPPEIITGVGQYAWNIVQGLARSGRFQSIRVLAGARSARGHPPLKLGDVAVDYRWVRDEAASVGRLLAEVRALRPDVVWLNLGFMVFGSSRRVNFLGLMLPWLLRGLGVPSVVTLHELYDAITPESIGARNGWLTTQGARLATRMLLRAERVCVALRRYQAIIQNRYGARNVGYIPLGVFTQPELLPHPPGAPRHHLLMFNAHAPYRGLPVLLEAFARVRRVYPEAVLTVAGDDHPRFTGYLAEQQARAKEAANVRWLGYLAEAQLHDVFAQASLVVMPYTATTGASSVLHRAVAYGRPVLASDLPDLRCDAEDENFWLDYAPPADPEALSEALVRLLADTERQQRLARHNLAVAQTMTLEHTCARYADLFAHVVSRRAAMRDPGWAVNP